MTERTDPAGRLADAWEANAGPWVAAVRGGRIASRAAVHGTSSASGAARSGRPGASARRPASPSSALTRGGRRSPRGGDPAGDCRGLCFAEFVATPDTIDGRFDVAVMNYAVFAGGVADPLTTAASVLAPGGDVVQTQHPWTAAAGDYRDGWRVEDFAGFAAPGEAWQPMPWYFRAMLSWMAVVRDARLAVEDLREPAATDAGEPLSLLLVAGRTA